MGTAVEGGWAANHVRGCRLTEQLAADCALLEALRVMDYSLLLGVHYRAGPQATPVNTDLVRALSLNPGTGARAHKVATSLHHAMHCGRLGGLPVCVACF